MSKINSRILWLSIITFIIFLFSYSCQKEHDCSDGNYYLTFIANNQRICYSNCNASLYDSIQQDPYSIYTSDYITFISSGTFTEINDTARFSSGIAINFPGKTIGIYNNDSLSFFDYTVYYITNKGDYSYPCYDINSSNVKGDFELVIQKYDLDKNFITGTFNGTIYKCNNNDSILISDGEFRGSLNEEKKK